MAGSAGRHQRHALILGAVAAIAMVTPAAAEDVAVAGLVFRHAGHVSFGSEQWVEPMVYAVDPAGRRVVTSATDRDYARDYYAFWDLVDLRRSHLVVYDPDREQNYWWVVVSVDGRWFVTDTAAQPLQVRGADEGIGDISLPMPGPIEQAALGPKGRWLLTLDAVAAEGPEGDVATAKPEVRLWDLETGAQTLAITGGVPIDVWWSERGNHFLVEDADGPERLFDAATGRELAQFEVDGFLSHVMISDDGMAVALVPERGPIHVRSFESGRELGIRTAWMHVGDPEVTGFTGDGERLLLAFNSRLSARDTGTWEIVASVDLTDEDWVWEATPDRDRVLIDAEGKIWTWDVITGTRGATIAPDPPVSSAALSPRGERVLVLDENGTLTLWNARTGEQGGIVAEVPGGEWVFWGEDGRRVLVFGELGVDVWEVEGF